MKKDDESFTSDLSDDLHFDIGDAATIRFLRVRNNVLSCGLLLQQFSRGYFLPPL